MPPSPPSFSVLLFRSPLLTSCAAFNRTVERCCTKIDEIETVQDTLSQPPYNIDPTTLTGVVGENCTDPVEGTWYVLHFLLIFFFDLRICVAQQ
jgi:hypothetical protein